MKKTNFIVMVICILFSLTVNASAASSTVYFEYNPEPVIGPPITDVVIPNTDLNINSVWDFFSPTLIPIIGLIFAIVITFTVSFIIIKNRKRGNDK